MSYLVRKYKLPDHWYPSDLQKRAKIDEYLHWHHLFLRRGAGGTIFQKVLNVHNATAMIAELHYNKLIIIWGESENVMYNCLYLDCPLLSKVNYQQDTL